MEISSFMRRYSCFFFFLFYVFSVSCSELENTKTAFYRLMGEKKEVWKELLNKEKPVLENFANLFANSNTQTKSASPIPQNIHFIWVGPKEFPKTSIKNIYSWIEKNPGYTFFFWSDRPRALPHPLMKLRLVDEFNWLFLQKPFLDSKNYGEQSDLLRYEILYQEGGIYVDHDVECFRPFDELRNSYDFFCAFQFPCTPIGASSLTICNNLIASTPNHPILKETIDNVLLGWDKYKALYPYEDVNSVTKGVYFRTFEAFDKAVKHLGESSDYKNGIFPAGYFNKLGKDFGIYAHHSYASTWFESEKPFETNIRQRLVKICKKNNQIMLYGGLAFLLSISLIIFLFIELRRIRKCIRRLSEK